MTNDQKAERFITAIFGFIAISLMITFNEVVSAGQRPPLIALFFGAVFDGGLCWLALKRKRFARIILGLRLLLPPAFTFSLSITGSEDVPALMLARHSILGLSGVALLVWRPLRDYTKKKEPNQPPQTTTGSSAPDRV